MAEWDLHTAFIPETAPADVIWDECICWKLCDRLYSDSCFFFVKTKRRRREKRERKHAGAHNVLLQWNHWNRRKNRKLCKREVCQQKLLFFLSSLLFLCWSRFSSHTLSISSYSSICLFSARASRTFYGILGLESVSTKISIQIYEQTNK